MIDVLNQALRRLPAWPLYPLSVLPVAWIYWQGISGGLGVDPVKEIEHQLGLWALWALIAGLAVTPLRRKFGVNLFKFRRAIGVISFFYIAAHLLTWLLLDVQLIGVWADIVKRPYITVGMGAFALSVPLAVTSNNWMQRRLGPLRWRKLHKLTYAICVLGAVHFVMLVKGFQLEPLLYLSAVIILLLMRLDLKPLLSKPFTRTQ